MSNASPPTDVDAEAEKAVEDVLGNPEEMAEMLQNFGKNGRSFKDFTALTPESMEVFYMVAHTQYGAGKYEDAEKVFRLLSVLDHFDTRFWKGLAASRENQGKHEEAVQAYSYLTLLDMKDPYPSFHAAKNLLAMGKVQEAKAALQAAIFNSQDNEENASLHQEAKAMMELVEKGEKDIEEAAK